MDMTDQPQQQAPNQEVDMTEAGPSDMDSQEESQGSSYDICIAVKGSKSFQVYIKRGEVENSLGDEGQSFDTFGDALRECLRLYKENPPSDAGASEQLQAGFGSTEQKY